MGEVVVVDQVKIPEISSEKSVINANTGQRVLLSSKKFANGKFIRQDFSDATLPHADFRGASCIECNFRRSDLRYANMESMNGYGSDFTDAVMTHTNCKDAILERSLFKPKDAFGITLTLKCETFHEMETDDVLASVWVFMALLMKLPKPLESRLINFFGPERYAKYKAVFERRVI